MSETLDNVQLIYASVIHLNAFLIPLRQPLLQVFSRPLEMTSEIKAFAMFSGHHIPRRI